MNSLKECLFLKKIYRNYLLYPKNNVRVVKENIKFKYNKISFVFLKEFKKNLLNSFFELRHTIPGYLSYTPLKEGDIVIDGGAGEGEFAVYCSKLVGPTGKVIVFEPNKNFLKIIEINKKLNKAENIEIHSRGLWSCNTRKGFIEDQISSKVSTAKNNFIDLVSLDKFFEENKQINKRKIKLIKLDVEGAEIEVVRGALNLLKRYSPKLSIACYHALTNKKEITANGLIKLLEKINYKTVLHYPSHLTLHAEKTT